MRRESSSEVTAWLEGQGVEPLAVRRVAQLDCSVWRVSMPGRERDLCLRIFPPGHRDTAQIDNELAWLQGMHADGLQVPGALPDAQGRLRRAWQPGPALPLRHAALLHWLPGRTLDRAMRPLHLRRLGELIARMHDCADRLAEDGRLRRGTRLAHNADLDAWACGDRCLGAGFPQGLQGAARAAAQALLHHLAAWPASPPHWGFIHGDLHPWNLLFHRGRAGAIDFGDSGWGHRLQDLASALQFIRHPIEGHADHRHREAAMRSALFEGYASRRPMPGDVQARIDMLIAARMLNTLQWIADDWPAIDHRPWGPRFIAGLESVLRHAARA